MQRLAIAVVAALALLGACAAPLAADPQTAPPTGSTAQTSGSAAQPAAGWYELARTPGEAGPAILLGHVDGLNKPGIFFRLKELVAGDEIEVPRKDGTTARFRVRKTEQIAKSGFPTEAVYGDTAEPELRLITCGGSFDRAAHSYRDNVIVYATLV
ncbi:sortase [Lentzea sp. NPDC004782]|uniref:sortase domain-containing protein n=1 Tax=Lentzea sp. NPDC004782 TaxID=3154458 RepID=UPI0033A39B32